MSTPESDLYQPLAALLAEEAPRQHPAELQGVICGLLATGGASGTHDIPGVLASHAGLRHGWSGAAAGIFERLRDRAREAFEGDSLELELMLPPGTVPLGDRVAALGLWCEGFMAGFGTGTAGLKDGDLPPSLQEAIADLAAISQVEPPDEDTEEMARMLEQVMEHCRVAALLVFTELALMRRRQKGDNASRPTTH